MKTQRPTHGFTHPEGYQEALEGKVLHRIRAGGVSEVYTNGAEVRPLRRWMGIAAGIALMGMAVYIAWPQLAPKDEVQDVGWSDAMALYTEIVPVEDNSLDALSDLVGAIEEDMEALERE